MVDEIRISSFIALEYDTLPDILKQKIIKELTLDNPEYLRMLKLGKQADNVLQHQGLYHVKTDRLQGKRWFILPRGFLPTLIQLYNEQERPFRLIGRRLIKPQVSFDSKIVLRKYQKPAVEKALRAKSGIIQAPCGSGKTIIGLDITAGAMQPALWLVHTKDLLQQALDRIEEYLQMPKNEIGIIGDGKRVIGEKITVGMVQSLARRLDMQLVNKFGLLLLDEAHHAPARTFSQVVGAFPALYRFGLTATPYRRDGMHPLMYYTIGYTIHKISRAELMQSGELVAPKFALIPTEFAFQYRDNYAGMIEALTQDEDRNRLIIQRVAQEAKAGHYCLVLSERIAHCELLRRMLTNVAPDVKAAVLIGELSGADRQKVLNGLRARKLNVVFATKVADEGLDISHLDRLFLATPYRSAHRVKQQVGRVMRPAAGKKDAVVYDFVDENVPVLKQQVEIRRDVYDSFADFETVETPLSLDAIEELYTRAETNLNVTEEVASKKRDEQVKKRKGLSPQNRNEYKPQ